MNYGPRLLVRAMAKKEARTWRYLFLRWRPNQKDGSHHGEEVAHVFGTYAEVTPGEAADFDGVDATVSGAMLRAWVAFGRSGNLWDSTDGFRLSAEAGLTNLLYTQQVEQVISEPPTVALVACCLVLSPRNIET